MPDAESAAMANRLDILMAQKNWLAWPGRLARPEPRHALRQPARPVLAAQPGSRRRARQRLRNRTADSPLRLGGRAWPRPRRCICKPCSAA
ncbi:hypothetical protein LP419_23435 [Massilia sp. H-1]|nr:hypothetical protein LP419_23435 [Massilia sp. H-1]